MSITSMSTEEILKRLKGKKKIGGFTYVKSQNTFKRNNCFLNMNEFFAQSYEWFSLLFVYEGNLILNTYEYSKTTARQISGIREVLKVLGIKPDFQIELKEGDQRISSSDQVNYLGSEYLNWLDKADLARTENTKSHYLYRAEYYAKQLKMIRSLTTNRKAYIANTLSYVSNAKVKQAIARAEKREEAKRKAKDPEVIQLKEYRDRLAKAGAVLLKDQYKSITFDQAFGM